MKFLYALLLAVPLALAGCVNHLPKPVNANGSVNPSVAVAEGSIKYAESANFATAYISTCHANMATIGCSEAKITQIKAAIVKADAAVHAAINAVKTLPPGATGIDAYIADMQAAIVFLTALVPTGGTP